MLRTDADLMVSGELRKQDAKRLTGAMRSGTIGPTSLYYAGVTAPVIGGGMSLLTSTAFAMAGMSEYWQLMLSAIIAAMSGIVWYLIFMRWSYRHHHGRASEMQQASQVSLHDRFIAIRRGPVETRIEWSGLTGIDEKGSYTLLRFDGIDPLIIPNHWFGKDAVTRDAFVSRLHRGKS